MSMIKMNKNTTCFLGRFHTGHSMKSYVTIIMWGDIVGKTSSKVKDRYNAKVYDEIKVRVHKGKKDIIKAHAEMQGTSVNDFINRAIDEKIEKDNKIN